MNSDIKEATQNKEIETLTFDMEKTLPLPHLSTNIMFYKRQLWLYNCGIYAAKEGKSTFNLWLEGQAGRGAQEKLEKEITNRKKRCEEDKFSWLKIKEIKLLNEKPFSIFIETTHDATDNYKEIDIKKGKGNPQTMLFSRHLQPLWPNGKPVAEAKLKDIKSYLNPIPPADHPFYVNLIGDDTIEEDTEGYNAELDFQIQED
ncbi:unnamed protein product [Acanthoscelides obtectus]|uniref:Uncharacterized protein n=1 Tax=Acanthoscelides obtectus TaxID=200917 RepID=A0A9P0Q237_ACAOB|nr:unnamed protein product [Acanthoscelides obtectus]CAK1672188.1 hypothetical protein AOBTE_LOCUS28705 [Acanthoscelides obtectus]